MKTYLVFDYERCTDDTGTREYGLGHVVEVTVNWLEATGAMVQRRLEGQSVGIAEIIIAPIEPIKAHVQLVDGKINAYYVEKLAKDETQ